MRRRQLNQAGPYKTARIKVVRPRSAGMTDSFEEDYERLEEVVESLDSGRVGDDLTLDEALELYEEGVELVRNCREHLDDAEATLETLNETDMETEADV